jgi:hypothetical protein
MGNGSAGLPFEKITLEKKFFYAVTSSRDDSYAVAKSQFLRFLYFVVCPCPHFGLCFRLSGR